MELTGYTPPKVLVIRTEVTRTISYFSYDDVVTRLKEQIMVKNELCLYIHMYTSWSVDHCLFL